MRKIASVAVFVVIAASVGGLAAANPVPTLSWGDDVNPGQCDTRGSPAVNVHYEIEDTLDSGIGSDIWWAQEDLNTHLQIYEVGDGTYCALIQNKGQFQGIEGAQSPLDPSKTLTGEEEGTIKGGYRAVIDGDLKQNPDWKTRGNVGTIDFNCDPQASLGQYPPECEPTRWYNQYFSTIDSFQFEWWGWIYHAGRCGTMEQSWDGSGSPTYEGNIVCPSG